MNEYKWMIMEALCAVCMTWEVSKSLLTFFIRLTCRVMWGHAWLFYFLAQQSQAHRIFAFLVRGALTLASVQTCVMAGLKRRFKKAMRESLKFKGNGIQNCTVWRVFTWLVCKRLSGVIANYFVIIASDMKIFLAMGIQGNGKCQTY